MLKHCFYHRADMDGHCSGAIVKHFVPDVELHPINYGDDFPWQKINREDTVYMVDFCLQPETQMHELLAKCERFIWLDHHKSSIAGVGKMLCEGRQDVNWAGCELTWQYFSRGPMPLCVALLGRYDIWDTKSLLGWDSDILPFQYGFRLYETDPRNNMPLWVDMFTNAGPHIGSIQHDGRTILRYQKEQNRRTMGAAFEVELDGLRCIAVNASGNSLTFESRYDPEKHDAMLMFRNQNNKFWTVSLYATKDDIDVSIVAKNHGGGGHKGASGFQCTELPFEIGRKP